MAISIDGLSSFYTGTATEAASSGTSLEKTLNNADLSNATDDELMDVCRQFEAYFVEQVFKAMEATVPKSENSDSGMSTMNDYCKEQLMQQYAAEATQGKGFGLAQTMYEQMKRNYSI